MSEAGDYSSSSPSPSAEAGPSTYARSHSAEPTELAKTAAAPAAQGRVRGRKGKAGGEGKKGKVFLEDRAGLLSLISKVTTTTEQGVQAKLDKRRQVEAEFGGRNASKTARVGNVTGSNGVVRRDKSAGGAGATAVASAGAVLGKKQEREKALRAAKIALKNEAREKKRLKKGKGVPIGAEAEAAAAAGGASKQGGPNQVQEKKVKKRVGFA